MQFRELEHLKATVDRVEYAPDLQTPEDRPYAFVYFITIRNDSAVAVELRGRKWVVRGVNGQVIVVEGDGIVGDNRALAAGESFSYNSCHVIACDSVAEGSYFGIAENGEGVCVPVPPFRMRVPLALGE